MIEQKNLDYLNISKIKSLAKYLNEKKELAIFAGAGISISAGIPGSKGIVKRLKKHYPDRLDTKRDYGYTEALNLVFPGESHKEERRNFFEHICAGKPPSREHHYIAHLIEHKKFQTVMTTNFDHLLETAVITRCSLRHHIYLYDTEISPYDFQDEFPKLFKLHGDFLFDDLANLDSEKRERLTKNLRIALIDYLQERGFVVVGYGGNDVTIMNLLEEIAKTKEGIKNGIFWVIYKKDDRKNERLERLIDVTKRNGKPAEIIGPISANSFFDQLCGSLDLSFPNKIPFGINPKMKSPVNVYRGRFGRASQRSFLKAYLDTNPPVSIEGFSGLLKFGVLWIEKAQKFEKEIFLKELFSKYDFKKIFYFSHRFSMNIISEELFHDLCTFASSIGISIWPHTRIDLLRALFKKDIVIVFDHVFPEKFGMKRQYWDFIIDIISVQVQIGRGKVILFSSEKLSNSDLIELHHGILEKEMGLENPLYVRRGEIITFFPAPRGIDLNRWELTPSTIIHHSRYMVSVIPRNFKLNTDDLNVHVLNLSDKIAQKYSRMSHHDAYKYISSKYGAEGKKALRLLSMMRFSDYIDVLKQCTEISCIENIFKDLLEFGQAEKKGFLYVLNEDFQLYIHQNDPPNYEELLSLGKKLHTLGPQKRGFKHSFHLLIEAENLYFKIEEWKEAIELFIILADIEIAEGLPDIAFHDLIDYLKQGFFESEIILSLPPKLQVNILIVFYDIWTAMYNLRKLKKIEDINLKYFFNTKLKEVLEHLPKVYNYILKANLELKRKNYDKAIELLIKAERICLKNRDLVDLGFLQLKIANAFNLKRVYKSSDFNEELKNCLKYAKRARRTYVKDKDETGIAIATDSIGAYLLDVGNYEGALRKILVAKDIITKVEGFTADKGALYANLFTVYIALSAQELEKQNYEKAEKLMLKAEGYFYESNLNYAFTSNWERITRNLITLFRFTSEKKQKKTRKQYPALSSIYSWIYQMLNLDPYNLFDQVFQTTVLWIEYNLCHMNIKFLISSFRNLVELTHFIFNIRSKKDAIVILLDQITKIYRKVGIDTFKSKIFPIILEYSPGYKNIYRSYCDWLFDPDKDIDQILEIFNVGKEWKPIMEEIVNSYNVT